MLGQWSSNSQDRMISRSRTSRSACSIRLSLDSGFPCPTVVQPRSPIVSVNVVMGLERRRTAATEVGCLETDSQVVEGGGGRPISGRRLEIAAENVLDEEGKGTKKKERLEMHASPTIHVQSQRKKQVDDGIAMLRMSQFVALLRLSFFSSSETAMMAELPFEVGFGRG